MTARHRTTRAATWSTVVAVFALLVFLGLRFGPAGGEGKHPPAAGPPAVAPIRSPVPTDPDGGAPSQPGATPETSVADVPPPPSPVTGSSEPAPEARPAAGPRITVRWNLGAAREAPPGDTTDAASPSLLGEIDCGRRPAGAPFLLAWSPDSRHLLWAFDEEYQGHTVWGATDVATGARVGRGRARFELSWGAWWIGEFDHGDGPFFVLGADASAFRAPFSGGEPKKLEIGGVGALAEAGGGLYSLPYAVRRGIVPLRRTRDRSFQLDREWHLADFGGATDGVGCSWYLDLRVSRNERYAVARDALVRRPLRWMDLRTGEARDLPVERHLSVSRTYVWQQIALSDAGDVAVVVPKGEVLVHWREEGREPERIPALENGDPAYSVDWSPSGRRLAVGYGANLVRILEAGTWRVVSEIRAEPDGRPDARPAHVRFSPDGRRVAVVLSDGVIRVLDAPER